METAESLNDVCPHHWHTTKAPLVQDTDIEGRGIELLFREVLYT